MTFPGSRSPSAWGEVMRDAGHDEMQIGVHEWIRDSFPIKSYSLPAWTLDGPCREFTFRARPELETPIIVGGKIVSFADISLTWFGRSTLPTVKHGMDQHQTMFEIKPKIDSVGGILRQLRAQTHLVQQSLPAPPPECDTPTDCHTWNDLWLVVKSRDPNIAMMKKAWSKVLIWDGKEAGV